MYGVGKPKCLHQSNGKVYPLVLHKNVIEPTIKPSNPLGPKPYGPLTIPKVKPKMK